MYRHPFRKSFGLIIIYSILIIGIFVLQFRNESVLSKNIGQLSVSFAQSQTDTGELLLKNTLQVAFKGISFLADEVNPAQLATSDEQGKESLKNLTLVSWKQETPLSFTFCFTENVALTFAVTGTDANAAFSITASLPESSSGLYLNYKPSSGFSVTERSKSKLILNSKNLTYAFTASQIEDTKIFLSSKNFVAYYVAYDPSVEFSFTSLDSDLIIAKKSTYDMNIKAMRENLISTVTNAVNSNQSLSEKSIIAYVAEMAAQGRYTEAINFVPDSFKKGNKRTYLSAPYFNSLDSIYPTFEMHRENMAEMISNAISTSSISVFTMEDLADYLNNLPDSPMIRKLLSLPDAVFNEESADSQIKISLASGILSTYIKLTSLHSSYADILLPAAQKCLKLIESHCVLNSSLLTLMEKDVSVSNYLALSTGKALVRWGEINNAPEYSQAGYAIVNSILSVNSLDPITLADIYPILADNVFYPHYQILSRTPAGTIWAWTCAPSIAYSMQDDSATISISFPKGDIHYLIINGVPSFYDIEIYGLSFHADARFESYNSSGFLYKENKNALFLKSRHKSDTEIVRLKYK